MSVLHVNTCPYCAHFRKHPDGRMECWFWPPTATPIFQQNAIKGPNLPGVIVNSVWGVRPPVDENCTCGQWKAGVEITKTMS